MARYRKPYLFKKKKSVFRNRFLWIGILILIFIISVSYFLFFSSFFQIKEIRISGNYKISTENLQETIKENLGKKILSLPIRSIFVLDSKQIEKNILDKFPQIGLIKIERKLPKILNVRVEERKPIIILNSGENNYFLDKEGICFEKVSNDDFQLPRIKSINLSGDLDLGTQIVTKELINSILAVISELKSLAIPPKEVEIVSDEKIDVKTEMDFNIYFTSKKDINWQLTKLKAVLEKQIPPEEIKNLDYIELRFGDFAPFKYRD